MKNKLFIAAMMLLLLSTSCQKQQNKTSNMDSLRTDIASICGSLDAEIGVAVLFENGDTLLIGNDTHYPMLSVVKFPQALAICHQLKRNQQSIDTTIDVLSTDLFPDTWSPMREQFPKGGKFSVAQLLDFSLVQSDNNACDILFKKVCSIAKTEYFVRQIGIDACNIRCDEQMMRTDPMNGYRNGITPWAAIQMLEFLYKKKDQDTYQPVWNAMARCETGKNRIPAGVKNPQAKVVHKTGTSGAMENGRLMGINDIGIIVLPDGSHITLAVFIKDANMTQEAAEKVIATVTERIINR